jgi:hypothetical protein
MRKTENRGIDELIVITRDIASFNQALLVR